MTLIFIADFLMVVLVGLLALLWKDYAREQARLRRQLEIRRRMEAVEGWDYYGERYFSCDRGDHRGRRYPEAHDDYKAVGFKNAG